jgi:hypothetical protein
VVAKANQKSSRKVEREVEAQRMGSEITKISLKNIHNDLAPTQYHKNDKNLHMEKRQTIYA